jgi:hypothetical protein
MTTDRAKDAIERALGAQTYGQLGVPDTKFVMIRFNGFYQQCKCSLIGTERYAQHADGLLRLNEDGKTSKLDYTWEAIEVSEE